MPSMNSIYGHDIWSWTPCRLLLYMTWYAILFTRLQGHSHQIWSGQLTSTSISMQQLVLQARPLPFHSTDHFQYVGVCPQGIWMLRDCASEGQNNASRWLDDKFTCINIYLSCLLCHTSPILCKPHSADEVWGLSNCSFKERKVVRRLRKDLFRLFVTISQVSTYHTCSVWVPSVSINWAMATPTK